MAGPTSPDHWVRHGPRSTPARGRTGSSRPGPPARHQRFLHVIPVHWTHETDGRLHHELVEHLHDAVVLNHAPSPVTRRGGAAGARRRA